MSPSEEPVVPSLNNKEDILRELSEFESRINDRTEAIHDWVIKQLNVVEKDIDSIKKSRLQEELASINAIGKHMNILEDQLSTRREEIDKFFEVLADYEVEYGKAKAYERAVANLRNAQMSFTQAYSELQQQRMLWNKIIERLRTNY